MQTLRDRAWKIQPGILLGSEITIESSGRSYHLQPGIGKRGTSAALGPMAVLPEHQRQGIGSKLIEAGNQRLAVAGYPFIVVVGHAHYYPRFGFTPASESGIKCEWEVT